MTATTPKEPRDDPDRSFWRSFSQADMRLLVVTFAGTVAANVMTVLLVATAILVAKRQPRTGRAALEYLLAGAVSLLLLVVCAVLISRRASRPWPVRSAAGLAGEP